MPRKRNPRRYEIEAAFWTKVLAEGGAAYQCATRGAAVNMRWRLNNYRQKLDSEVGPQGRSLATAMYDYTLTLVDSTIHAIKMMDSKSQLGEYMGFTDAPQPPPSSDWTGPGLGMRVEPLDLDALMKRVDEGVKEIREKEGTKKPEDKT